MQILSFSFTYLLTGVFEKICFYSHDFFINISLTVSFEYSLTFASNNVAQAAQMFQIPQKRLLVEDKFYLKPYIDKKATSCLWTTIICENLL